MLSFYSEKVDAIERIKPLVEEAKKNLSDLSIDNVFFKHSDGYQDWKKNIKYDGILCAAAPRVYPDDLVSALKPNAKLVIPVGGKDQKLNVISVNEKNEINKEEFDDVSFVPMLPGISEDGNEL